MGVYPVMYALLDIQRAAAGLYRLKALQISYKQAGHGRAWYGDVRDFDPAEGAKAFVEEVAWVNAEPAPTSLEITLNEQSPLATHARDRYAFATIGFSGEKWGTHLPSSHPVHPVVTALLRATQPAYALVTGDTISPDLPEDARYFREPWLFPYVSDESSMFFGPELLPHIPPDLLSPVGGFAHVERLEGGVWVTLPGFFTDKAKFEDPSILERHKVAFGAVRSALARMPSPSWTT